MWQLLVVVSGCLLVSAQETTPPPRVYYGRYMILAPNTIRPGLPLTLSATIYETVGSDVVSLTIAVLKDTTEVVSTASEVRVGTSNFTLQIPSSALPGDDYSLKVVATGGLVFEEEESLYFNVEHFSIFVQSDKAIYKPGQTVHFRVMAVYPNLRPYVGPFTAIKFVDANGNIIQQWLDREPNTNGIISDEIVMSDHPVLGDWMIKVEAEGQTYDYQFQIDEYVLPKFEVSISVPPFIDSSTAKIPIIVNAKYTFGKPVKGRLSLRVGLLYYEKVFIDDFKIDGTVNVTLKRSILESLKGGSRRGNGLSYMDQFKVSANVTETLTGIMQSAPPATLIHYTHPIKVDFSESVSRSNFKPGLLYQTYLLVTRQDGSPLTDTEREVGLKLWVCTTGSCWGDSMENWVSQTLSIARHTGVVQAFIPTSSDMTRIELKACYDVSPDCPIYDSKQLSPSRSNSNTYLQVRAEGASALTIGTMASFHVESTTAPGTLTYQIVSRGNIIASEQVSGVDDLEYTIRRQITSDMSPKSKLVAYFIGQDGEIILDSLEFVVNVVFDNQITASFSRVLAKPGSSVNFDVQTTPGAFVGILTVDKSVLLLADGNDITHNQVLQSVGRFDTTPEDSWDFWNPFADIAFCFFPYYTGGDSAGNMLKQAGIIYITDGNTLYEEHRIYFDGPLFAAADGIPEAAAGLEPQFRGSDTGVSENEVKEIRKEFPETWLWVDTEADSNGRVSISTKFPDTITSWVGTAISMDGAAGLGVTENATTATVFKKFFVSLNLPYSVIRGEKFVLGATVFNYLDTDITAMVELQSSQSYMILEYTNSIEDIVTGSLIKKVKIPANEGMTVNFPIQPTKIGAVELVVTASSNLEQDGVRRFLLVEAEGVAQEYVSSDLVDLSSSNSYSKTFTINLPSNVVPDSVRASITATGDILGPTMNNLDQLLRMPTGCGEQTMISFAPDVFIYKYLQETNQSNAAIEQTALNFMKTGYQHELTYQHSDGSFSAWGEKYGDDGSTWLTAFVVRSFLQASPYIFIDPAKVELALSFLLEHQANDGWFEASGKIIDRGIEGGVSSRETLTAYVAIAMHQARIADIISASVKSQAQTSLDEAMGYLENRYSAIQEDKYAMAIVTYALALGGSAMASQFRARLDELQSNEADGSLAYWTEEDMKSPSSDDYFSRVWWGPPSASIEMTGYGLLAYLSRNDVTASVPVARWLSQQRNSLGGYSSTQNTVIGLMALTSYAARISAGDKQIIASIVASEDTTYAEGFQIENENSIILQQFDLPVDRGDVTVVATGTGSFLLSFVLHYNRNEVGSNRVFDVDVSISDASQNSILLNACGSYTGTLEGTGMAIMDIGLPSGFYAPEDQLAQTVSRETFATKYEILGQSVIIYFSEIPKSEVCLSIQAQRSKLVAEIKPSIVKVYSYYNPTDQTVVSYSAAVLAKSNICELCPDCCPSDSSGTVLPTDILLLTLALVSLIGTLVF